MEPTVAPEALADSNRELLARGLGVKWGPTPSRESAYRAAASAKTLEGKWVGAFAQPAVVLHSVSAMSLDMTTWSGVSQDEYGRGQIALVARDGDRVVLHKTYNGNTFAYVGMLTNGVFAGYWCALAKPDFAGLFCFVKEQDGDPATVAALHHRVLHRSTRRFAMRMLPIAVLALALATLPLPYARRHFAFALVLAVPVLLAYAYRGNKESITARVAPWRKLLGGP